MRVTFCILFISCIAVPTFAQAAVVVNEVAWMGTSVSANAEWIELANTGASAVDLTGWHLVADTGSPSITLSGSISANGYFLLERTSDASVPNISADQIYSGALTNGGATLTLTTAAGATADQVVGGANWANIGGDNASKETAQRTSSGWETAAATPRAINVGVSAPSADSSLTSSASATNTPTTGTSVSNGSPPEFLPIPSLRIITGGSRTVSSSADTAFTAVVYDGKGNKRDDATVSWSFGDGMRKVGASVFHSYYDPGEYLAVVHATTPDGGEAFAESVISVQDVSIKITSVTARGISIENSSPRTLDLSLWQLAMGGHTFKIPEDTHILAGHTTAFPSQVTELPLADAAFLLYPSGEVAASYPALKMAPQVDAVMQPSPSATSYEQVQAVEPISSTKTNVQAHEEALAPTAATELAAVGAVQAEAPSPRASSIFRSPWTLGFLGVVLLSGGAFILL